MLSLMTKTEHCKGTLSATGSLRTALHLRHIPINTHTGNDTGHTQMEEGEPHSAHLHARDKDQKFKQASHTLYTKKKKRRDAGN